MKRIYVAFLLLCCTTAVLTLSSSCKIDNDANPTFLEYSVNGPSLNGAFRIDDSDEPTQPVATSFLTEETEDTPAVIFIQFNDYTPGATRTITFQLPGRETGNSPVLMTYDSENFGMGINHEEGNILLVSGVENTLNGVSVDVQKFERNVSVPFFSSVKQLTVYFVGIMSYENKMNEIEQHTVEGRFHYNGVF